MSRRKGASNKQNEAKCFSRDSRAVPAPSANAELLASIQVSIYLSEIIDAYMCHVCVCTCIKPLLLSYRNV